MKKLLRSLIAVLFISIVISGCNEASQKNMTDANKNLKEANQNIKEAVIATNDTAKANAIANWTSFKIESDSAIVSMERDVATLEGKMDKASYAAKTTLKTDLDKTKNRLQELKEKLKQGNIDFENGVNHFDATMEVKNQSFQREFKHDMNEFGTSFKDLFKNNVK